jgi:thioredoxin:protein disulfide reductase
MFNRFKRLLLSTAQTVIFGLLLTSFAQAEEDYLKPEDAFRFSASMIDAKTIAVSYAIADGYYMYRDRFKFEAVDAKLGEPVIPPGKVKFDETFQKDVETYHNAITIRLPVEAGGAFTLNATGQGCADKGLCYPPQTSTIKLSPDAIGASAITPGTTSIGNLQQAAGTEMGRIEASLKSGKLLVILPLFALLGLGLAFTPCVLPMVPILSCIIVGDGERVSRSRGFYLSATYALGMALVYTALGVAAGLVGEGLAAALQNPLVLGAFALLMVVLSLSMFGVYQLQVPASIQLRLMKASEMQSSGKYFGVFAMGAISALIVGPCVAAPLAGALLYISQTRDVVIGGSALFAMAVGMSLPLLLVGVSAGALLPRAGAWMEAVKRFFGVLMLAMALWLVSPVIPAWVQMLGWSALGLGSGIWLLLMQSGGKAANGVGLALAALGLVQLVGVASGGRDAWSPLAHFYNAGQAKPVAFDRVKSVAELDAALKRSQAQGKVAMLDFYADWCVSCKEMEKFTLSDQRVRAQLNNMHLLQVDVTANDADDKAMLKRFNLFGPPGIIFFDRNGGEIHGGRVIGYQDAEKFLRSLVQIKPI